MLLLKNMISSAFISVPRYGTVNFLQFDMITFMIVQLLPALGLDFLT